MADTLRISIPITAEDKTRQGLQSAEKAITAFEKVVDRVNKLLDKFEGPHNVELEATDRATQKINQAEQAVENFAGAHGSADIGVSDHASEVVAAAQDKVEAFGGMSGSADIGANDNASSIIDAVMDKAAAWAGTAWTATIGIVDAVTAPLSKIGQALTSPLVAGAGALGVSFGVTDALNTYKDFEAQMSEVAAISGTTGSELDALTEKAKVMGATTKFTATEAGEAFSYMAMAGWKAGQMTDGIEGIMSLAAASGENLGTVSDIVTDALTAFGLTAGDAGHFADVLAQASSNANTNVSMLGESFKYVAPVAGAMGYSVEDVSTALGLMANASIKGSMAGTALKTSLANMAAPSDKMATYMDRYGISLTDTDGRMKSLSEVIQMLRDKMGGLTETEQTAAASAIFGKEAMAGMLAIINASEQDYANLAAAINNADGAAQNMSDTMMDNLQGSLTLMGSAIDGLKTSFGERLAPYVQEIAEGITGAIPGVDKMLGGFMDGVDRVIGDTKTRFKLMTASDEFQKANLFGKVNIAWNKIVAEPFMKWAGSKGKHMLSGALGGLFEEAGKILPGGEDAGIMSWLSAGVIAKGATTAVSGISKLVAAAGTIHPALGVAAGAAAGLASAIGLISLAIDNYNQKQITASFEEKFGSVTLSATEARTAAEQILNADYLVDVTYAINEYKNADETAQTAETYLTENKKLLWQAHIDNVELTADELTTYKDNIESYLKLKKQELNERTHAVYVSIDAIVTGNTTGNLKSAVDQWAQEDSQELTNLQAQMQALIEGAIEGGIDDVNVQGAVDELTKKINEIEAKWKDAQVKAEFDLLEQKRLSGAGLTVESYQDVVDQIHELLTEEQEALDIASRGVYASIEGHATGQEAEDLKTEWRGQERNRRAESTMRAVNFETNTISDTYGDLIARGVQDYKDKQASYLANIVDMMAYGWDDYEIARALGDMSDSDLAVDLAGLLDAEGNEFGSANATAAKELLDIMRPDVEKMSEMIDEYISMGAEIPKDFMESYYDSVAALAAAGDEDAMYTMLAQSLLKPENAELLERIMSEEFDGMSEGLQTALNRAMAAVSVDYDLINTDLKAGGGGADPEAVQRLLDEAASRAGLRATATGDVIELDGGTIAIGYNIEIAPGDTLSGLSRKLGIELQDLKDANKWLEGREGGYDYITTDDTIYIPAPPMEIEPESLDTAASDIQNDVVDEIVEKTEEADLSEAGQNIADSVADSVDDADRAPIHQSVVDLYIETRTDVQDTFSTPIDATCPVNVEFQYNYVNPLSGMTFKSGGGAAGKYGAKYELSAYADGGLVTSPSIAGEAGPEMVIPLTGSHGRSMELLAQAAQMLGAAPDSALSPAAAVATGNNNNVPVNISLAPTFNVDGTNKETIVSTIRENLNGLVNEVINEVGKQVEQAINNTPSEYGYA